MNVDQARRFFLDATNPNHRRYEALRALFLDKAPLRQTAKRFGYAAGSLRNLRAAFLRDPHPAFFLPDARGRNKPHSGPQRDKLILALRTERHWSAPEIADHLTDHEKIPVSTSTVSRVLRDAGLPKLPRRPASLRRKSPATAPLTAPVADQRQLDLTPRRLHSDFGGLFLFVPDLVRLDFDRLLADHRFPGSQMLPPACAFRALLALKLWHGKRHFHVMPDVFDPGLALFAGLNAIPKRSSLSEYSIRVDPRLTPRFMDDFHHAVQRLGLAFSPASSFDLDFHTVPYHGKDALLERHYVSKRSRRQKGVLSFLARDADARVFVFADSSLRKSEQSDAILSFVKTWKDRTGSHPRELVFDSKLTTYANLAKLNKLGILFLTVRRRSAQMLAKLAAVPPEQWTRVTLSNVGRIYRTPRILSSQVRLRGYPGPIRQIAVADLGHEDPTFLLTNQLQTAPSRLIDRYARRMVIENTIADAINFFHMDALSCAVPLRINFDLQLTLIANSLYRLLGQRVGEGLETARCDTLFHKLVRASATIDIRRSSIEVRFRRRANNPFLLNADYARMRPAIPWLDGRTLILRFP